MKRRMSLLLAIVIVFSVMPGTTGRAEDVITMEPGEVYAGGAASGSGSEDGLHWSDGEGQSAGTEETSASGISNMMLASDRQHIWRVFEGVIRCKEANTGRETAACPISDLCTVNEDAMFASVASWGSGRVLLCLALRAENGTLRVVVRELWENSGVIECGEERDATACLGIFFDGSEEWNELSLSSCGQKLMIEALDADFMMRIYCYDPEADQLVLLGEQSLMTYLAGIPTSEGFLLISPNFENGNEVELNSLAITNGSSEYLGTARIDSASNAGCFAYNEEENLLYYALNSTAYAVKLGGNSSPEAIGAFPAVPEAMRVGTLAGDRYVVLAEGGEQLLSCDVHGHLDTMELHIADAGDTEAVYDAAGSFSLEHPGFTVLVSDSQSEEDILDDILNRSAEYDAFVITLDSDVYRRLISEDRLADLSGCAALVASVEDMPDYLRSELLAEGKLLAMPVSAVTLCQTVNVDAMQTLMGLSRERIPTDWLGFLKLMRKMASQKVMTKETGYSIYGEDVPSEEFQMTVFSWILGDALLWVEEDGTRISRLQKTLVPVLDAYRHVDWNGLGLLPEVDEEAADEEFFSYGYSTPVDKYVLMDGAPEIEVMDMAEGEEFWPLSIGDGRRLVAQTVSVICVNPSSPHQDAVLDFLKSVWENTDITTKMTFCQSMGEPVLNEDYEDDLAYMEDLARSYGDRIEATDDEMEKEFLTAEWKELTDFVEDYRENARWMITEESLAAFRAMNDQFVVSGAELWGMEDEESPTWQFLSGEISSKQYVKYLVAALGTAA